MKFSHFTTQQNKPLHAKSLHIETTRSEIEENTNMVTGLLVGDLDVDNEDGTYTRFHIYLRINKQGQAVAELSTNNKEGTRSTVKTLTGVKRQKQ